MSIFETNRPDLRERAAAIQVGWRMFYPLVIGLVLLSPAATAREKIGCEPTVTVSEGDTLSRIARRCGTSVPVLLSLNPQILDPDVLPLGSVLATSKPSEVEEEPSVETTGSIAVEPPEAGPGERVTLKASGLPARTRVWIKGGSRSPEHHLVLRGARTDSEGELRTTLRLPQWSKAAESRYRLSIEVPRTGAILLSPPLASGTKRSASQDR